MSFFNTIFLLGVLLVALVFNIDAQNRSIVTPEGFNNLPDTVKVHTWWHWIDGNITKEGITKDLQAMSEQGISQATILNVGVSGKQYFGVKEIKFDTPEWYSMFFHALKEAERLGITIGVHNCDGWSTTGGPWITPEYAMKEITWSKCLVKGGGHINTKLRKPYSMDGFYKDVATIAVKTGNDVNSFTKARPTISLNNTDEVECMYDGCPIGGVLVEKGDTITIDFKEAFKTEKIAIHPRKTYIWGSLSRIDNTIVSYTLLAVDSLNSYKKILDFKTRGFNKTASTIIPPTVSKSYKLIVNDFKNTDDFFISELELLKESEIPQYETDILYHQTKTSSVQGSSDGQFFNVTKGMDKEGAISFDDIINITANISPKGVLEWDAPNGNWEIIRFGYTLTGKKNHPATEHGEGLECDKLDAKALDLHFSNFPQKLINQAGKYTGNTFKFLLIDSWECFFQNWTKGFPAEFERVNGYPIIKWLPVLCGKVVENQKSSESFLYDFRRTIAVLIENNYYKRFADLCHKNGLDMHGEVIYGGCKLPPLDVLKAYSYTDMPMFEYWARQDNNVLFNYKPVQYPLSHFASSAGLFYDKPVVGSEAYTGYATFSDSPWGLKPFGDMAYCSGINQMILHSYVHQPGNQNPGITLRNYGQPFNRLNTYWGYLSGWTAYQAKIQYMLQNTNETSDILFYVGDHLPQIKANLKEVPEGYGSNVCNYDILKNMLHVKDHKIVSKKGASFSILVLPDQEGISYKTLLRLKELIKQGAIVYGSRPLYLYSLSEEKMYQNDFEKLIREVWGSNETGGGNVNEYGKGKVIWGMPLSQTLKHISLSPDFITTSGDTANFMFTHKQNADTDIYFVFNQLNQEIDAECTFRIGNTAPEIWNPITGSVEKTDDFVVDRNSCTLKYSFKPNESVFFVFKDKVIKNAMKKNTIIKEYKINDFDGIIEFIPAYEMDISPVKINKLTSLSEYNNPDIKYFSGEAKYTLNFQFQHMIDTTEGWRLNLGEVSAAARAKLNGRDLGIIWFPHQELEVGNILKKEGNILEVTVAIPYRNRFIGDFKKYGEVKSLWTTCEIKKYLNADTPLMQVGLANPIKILRYNKKNEL